MGLRTNLNIMLTSMYMREISYIYISTMLTPMLPGQSLYEILSDV